MLDETQVGRMGAPPSITGLPVGARTLLHSFNLKWCEVKTQPSRSPSTMTFTVWVQGWGPGSCMIKWKHPEAGRRQRKVRVNCES